MDPGRDSDHNNDPGNHYVGIVFSGPNTDTGSGDHVFDKAFQRLAELAEDRK